MVLKGIVCYHRVRSLFLSGDIMELIFSTYKLASWNKDSTKCLFLFLQSQSFYHQVISGRNRKWKNRALKPDDMLDVHEPDPLLLHLNNNKNDTNGSVHYSARVLWRVRSSCHITFFKRWVSLHPGAAILPLRLPRVPKKVISPLDNLTTRGARRNTKHVTPASAWRNTRRVTTRNFSLLISYLTTTAAALFLMKPQFCAPPATNDLERTERRHVSTRTTD